MAPKTLENYPYHVELIELRANCPKDIRLYKKPSDMDRFTGSRVLDPSQNFIDLKKYGISDRRIDINCPIDRSGPEKSSAPFKGLEYDKRNPYPDFIGNQTTFKSLLAPDRGPSLFLAKRSTQNRSTYLRLVQMPKQEKWPVQLKIPSPSKSKKLTIDQDFDDAIMEEHMSIVSEVVETISLEETTTKSEPDAVQDEEESIEDDVDDAESNSITLQTTGFVLERVLSTAYEAERQNKLFGLFIAKLGKFEDLDEISLTFSSELDGLQYSDERAARISEEDFKFNSDDLKSVIEVKAINTNLFYPRTSGDKQRHFYENNVLRKYWAQGRLIALESILCGVVEMKQDINNPTVKEVWTMNVSKIPEILQIALKTREAWKRAFPASILTPMERRKVATNTGMKCWDEKTCFKEFHTALDKIKFKMHNSKPGDFTYFIYNKKKMLEIPKIHDVELSCINSSVLMTVNHVRNQVIDTYQLRDSIVTSLKGLASGDSTGMEFLKNWSVADIKLNRSNQKKTCNTVYLKLMFRCVKDAKKILKSWTNPRRVKEHHIVASWAAPSSTLRAIFKRVDL